MPAKPSCLILILVLLCGSSRLWAEPPTFNRDVRPILADNCFQCHGPDDNKRQGKLRLDISADALRGGKSGKPAIVAGKSGESNLVAHITSSDPEQIMPPPASHKKLTAGQIATLKAWIEGGAKYEVHWAFVAPWRPTLPAVTDGKWARNDLDRFVLARLDQEGLKPSAEADRAALLRRLSLDLIGLPPTPGEIDAFVADASPDAYEKQVDRLLSSEHFGEKWARHWLDVARYSDSDGFEKDLPRQQSAWRDWVINAINQDKPYDQFIIEQIGGDLLPNATQEQRIATGFLRNGMVNEEGAVVAEQFRMEGLIDRIDCIGKSVLGLTLQCAQCHSHKFDPLTNDEYYRLMAYLNDDYEAISRVYTAQELERINDIEKRTSDAEAKLKAEHADWPAREAAWEEAARKSELAWNVLEPTEQVWIDGLAHPQKLADNSILTLGFRPSDGELYVVTKTASTNLAGLRLEALTHGDLIFNGPGRSHDGTFAISELTVEASPVGRSDWKKVALANATSDVLSVDQPIGEFFRKGADDKRRVGPASYLIDGKDETAWSPDRGPGRRNQDCKAVVQFAQPVGFAEGTQLKVTLKYKHGGSDPHGRANHFLGRFRLSVTGAVAPTADPLPRRVREALSVATEQRTAEQNAEIFSCWRATVEEFKPYNQRIDEAWATYPSGSSILNLAQRSPVDHRDTFTLERGNWQKPLKKVEPGVPAFLNALPAGAPATRLALAKWLASRDSPTTARVEANRVWQAIFGAGIVETSEDFGTRVSEPSHPALLDWLAVEFMDRGWSLKRLVRTIVTSATYRQDSKVTPELRDRDPRNRLLARGPRFRVEAEVVRDVALSAAGLLNGQVGGPSFFPPVPESVLNLSFLKVDFWQTATGAERYRRSLYVFRRRSMPDPLLSCFDAPNADAACARRVRSDTPLAALAAMNETTFVEAAQALSLRVLREGGANDEMRARYGYRLCTGREALAVEVDALLSLLKSSRARIAAGWLSSREITTGDPARLPEIPANATPTDAAAWTIVARVLLNLDETVTKG